MEQALEPLFVFAELVAWAVQFLGLAAEIAILWLRHEVDWQVYYMSVPFWALCGLFGHFIKSWREDASNK